MEPREHIAWVKDNTDWFIALPESSLHTPVPACPGWTIETVVSHLAFGVGAAYPYGLHAAADTSSTEAFKDVPRPPSLQTAALVLEEFALSMRACIAAFEQTDPATPCFTYEGPGVAAFWFRRAAIETTIHRMDVAEALHKSEPQVSIVRAIDAVKEAIEFALPLAAQITAINIPAITVQLDEHPTALQLGSGEPAAQVRGPAIPILSALWGRSTNQIQVDGDQATAERWLSQIQIAFAGR